MNCVIDTRCRNIKVGMINVMCTHSAVGAIYQIKCYGYKTIATRMDRVSDQSSELHLLTWKHRKEHEKCSS